MADIKQAAKWMSEGKKVRRQSFPLWILSGDWAILGNHDREWAKFRTQDLLAEDWEIAE